MPELPEVETIVRELDEVLKGRVICGVEVINRKSFPSDAKALEGRIVKSINRLSKMIVVEFEKWDKKLVVHLKMTGQFVWRNKKKRVAGGHPTEDWVGELPSKHSRVVINFTDGSELFFNDLRKFGWMKLMEEKEWKKLAEKYPPDVIDKEFSLKYFKEVLGKGRRAVKLVIMDQAKIGGVGNIYACDALWEAKIAPDRKVNELKEAEIERLYKAIKKAISLGIKYKGATYSDFVSSRGIGGKYQEHFRVYARAGKPCKKCGEKIVKVKLGGRGTYFCKKCQK